MNRGAWQAIVLRVAQSHTQLKQLSTHTHCLLLSFLLQGYSMIQYMWFDFFFFYSRLRITSGEGSGTPLQYSCLENPLDGGAWKAAVHGVTEGQIQLNDFTFTFHFHALEKEMTTHSSVIAWRTPGMGEPGGLPSMGSHRVGHDWSDLAARITRSMDLVSYTAFYFFVIIAPCSIINLFRLFISISF